MRSTPIMVAFAVIALVVAAAAAAIAWQKNGELEGTKRELANTVSDMEKAKAAALSAKEETSALRKDLVDQKAAQDRLRSELSTANAFLEAEKTTGARLRQELAALTSKTRPAAAAQRRSGFDDLRVEPAVMAPVGPIRIIATPAPAPASNAVRAQPAPVPSGGYSR